MRKVSRLLRRAGKIRPVGLADGYAAPEWRREGKRVVLSGLLRNKRKTWRALAVLPEAARPDRTLVFETNAHAGRARVVVQADGVIRLDGAASRLSHGWVSLNGVSYSIVSGKRLPLNQGLRSAGGEDVVPRQ